VVPTSCGERLWALVLAAFEHEPPAVRELVDDAVRTGRVGFEAALTGGSGAVAVDVWLDGRLVFTGEAPYEEESTRVV
jgi:hypothetical protein